MGKAIERVSSSGIPGYEHLFEMDHRYDMSNLEVESIILEVCKKDRVNQLGRKWVSIDTRYLNQDEQAGANQAKIEAYHKKLGINLSVLSAVCSMTAAVASGAFKATTVGGVLTAGATLVSSAAEHTGRLRDATITGLDHRYQRNGTMYSERSQLVQGADREYDQATQIVDRVTQGTQRTFELIASSSS
jgi:hypothetical protein